MANVDPDHQPLSCSFFLFPRFCRRPTGYPPITSYPNDRYHSNFTLSFILSSIRPSKKNIFSYLLCIIDPIPFLPQYGDGSVISARPLIPHFHNLSFSIGPGASIERPFCYHFWAPYPEVRERLVGATTVRCSQKYSLRTEYIKLALLQLSLQLPDLAIFIFLLISLSQETGRDIECFSHPTTPLLHIAQFPPG